MRKEGLAHWKKISGGSPSLAGRDGDVSLQTVNDRQNQSADLQRSGRGNNDLLSDLGNNAARRKIAKEGEHLLPLQLSPEDRVAMLIHAV